MSNLREVNTLIHSPNHLPLLPSPTLTIIVCSWRWFFLNTFFSGDLFKLGIRTLRAFCRPSIPNLSLKTWKTTKCHRVICVVPFFSSVGSVNNRLLTTQRFDRYALIVFSFRWRRPEQDFQNQNLHMVLPQTSLLAPKKVSDPKCIREMYPHFVKPLFLCAHVFGLFLITLQQ